MENIKTKIYMLGMAAAIMLCGCENSESEPPDLNTESSLTSAVFTSETVKNTQAAETTAETIKVTETTAITEAEETVEETKPGGGVPSEIFDPSTYFEVREFPDDKIVPSEWIPVYSFAEAAKNFDKVVSADVSNMNTADAIIALANKNIIFVDSFVSYLFWDADMDHPYYSENYKNPYYPDKPIYPMSLEYFTDIQEIYDLGAETYTEEKLKKWYTPTNPFMKENDAFYVDVWGFPIWNFAPFMYRTYIEIISETEDKCSFIWHRPDWEKLNEPKEGYEYFYYNCNCEAVYENGSWKLSKVYVEGYSLI